MHQFTPSLSLQAPRCMSPIYKNATKKDRLFKSHNHAFITHTHTRLYPQSLINRNSPFADECKMLPWKTFVFVQMPSRRLCRSRRVEENKSKNSHAMLPRLSAKSLYKIAAHSCLYHAVANAHMYALNRRIDLFVDWFEKLSHVQCKVGDSIIRVHI